MKVIVVGLGKMGTQIAKMLQSANHQVIAVDRDYDSVKELAVNGILSAHDRAEAIKLLNNDRPIVWLMIPSAAVDDEVTKWLDLLPADSILVDGGNTDFRHSQQHAGLCAERSIKFVDVGVSGGILGSKNGFSMMAGGDEYSYQQIKPILDVLSGPRGGYEYFGAAGSGHYVKMVHNAIEYGMMESLAEGYRMLNEGSLGKLDLAKAGTVWQKASVIESTLNGLLAESMQQDQELRDVDGVVAESGEARWTLEEAKRLNISMPAIQAAFDVRLSSQKGDTTFASKLLAVLRNKFGGHTINQSDDKRT